MGFFKKRELPGNRAWRRKMISIQRKIDKKNNKMKKYE